MARRREKVETTEYAAFCRRVIRAYGRRIEDADEVDLAEMIRVRDEMDAVIGKAVRAQQARHSWAYVARGLGVSRQAAQMRYGRGA